MVKFSLINKSLSVLLLLSNLSCGGPPPTGDASYDSSSKGIHEGILNNIISQNIHDSEIKEKAQYKDNIKNKILKRYDVLSIDPESEDELKAALLRNNSISSFEEDNDNGFYNFFDDPSWDIIKINFHNLKF